MLILLPPSEGKATPRRGKPLTGGSLSFPMLEASRAQVLEALVSLCSADIERAAGVLGLGKTQTEEVLRNAELAHAPTARADRIYSGVLYDALDVGSLEGAARRRATQWLAVTSALFGLLRMSDSIPAYRLSGTVTLPGVGSVSGFWSRHLDAAVPEAAGRGLVVDLRSSTYASFWRPDAELARRTVTLRVLHEVDGQRKVVSHFNKATKGRLVRALVQDGTAPRTPAAFVAHLGTLGWHAEQGAAGRGGVAVDVVVREL